MFMHTHSFVSSTFVAIIDSAYGYRVSIHLSESLHCALASGAVYCNRSCLFVCLFVVTFCLNVILDHLYFTNNGSTNFIFLSRMF